MTFYIISVAGYLMLIVGIAFVPISITLTMYKNKTGNFLEVRYCLYIHYLV